MPVLLFSWQVNKQQKVSTVTTKTSVSAWNFTLGAAREKLFANLFDRLDKNSTRLTGSLDPLLSCHIFFFFRQKSKEKVKFPLNQYKHVVQHLSHNNEDW